MGVQRLQTQGGGTDITKVSPYGVNFERTLADITNVTGGGTLLTITGKGVIDEFIFLNVNTTAGTFKLELVVDGVIQYAETSTVAPCMLGAVMATSLQIISASSTLVRRPTKILETFAPQKIATVFPKTTVTGTGEMIILSRPIPFLQSFEARVTNTATISPLIAVKGGLIF